MLVYIPWLFISGALFCCFLAVIIVVRHFRKDKKIGVVGTLKMVTDEDGESYMFLEVDKGKLETIEKSDKILLRVKQLKSE